MPDTPSAVREHLVRALEADLVGPFLPDQAATFEEVLSLPPSRWYLTGFLAPEQGREPEAEAAGEGGEGEEDDPELDPTREDELASGPDDNAEEAQAGAEAEPKQKNRFPSSLGLSVLLPPGGPADAVRATVTYADYEAEPAAEPREEGGARRRGRPRMVWRRVPRPAVSVAVPLDADRLRAGLELRGTGGLWLVGKLEAVHGHSSLPDGARALALFVVNRRRPGPQGRRDEGFIFQVGLEVAAEGGILPRSNRRDEGSEETDEQVADLQFRERAEYAVGHGVSVTVPRDQEPVRRVCTTWIPRAEVARVEARKDAGVALEMETLAELADGAAARVALAPLAAAYGGWIADQRAREIPGAARAATRDRLMDCAAEARDRIAAGVELLAEDPEVLTAFRLANRAMALAARRARSHEVPAWRPFQLAFVLLNLRGLADGRHPDRETVELVFFPTGGGKTEAYLGVIAFTLVLRRLRGRDRPDGGLGVAVLLRYTLRLLTLDQLARAATLVCALESLRRSDPGLLGESRFAIGLWVGRGATANRLAEVAFQIGEYKAGKRDSPFPLTECPWCKGDLTPDSLTVRPLARPREVIVACTNGLECEFAASRHPEGLPVLFVDEQIYQELPGFLVATVDKFALLPWFGRTGFLFGRVDSRDREGRFGGPADGPPARGATPLPDGLLPPELIVQDELHLIAGPLGTMVGLYEAAIGALAARHDGAGPPVGPKILASTATVRRAAEQIRALFGRRHTAIFPPPGPDDGETWFARVDRTGPGRLYLGVAAPGRPIKAILLRVDVALLAAAHRVWDPDGKPDQPADVYLTLAGYFNSLRELGGMRRLVEDEVRSRTAQAAERAPIGWTGEHPWFRNRELQYEPAELTSRESTARIAGTRSRLAQHFRTPRHVDVLLASNMISVGVDIERLGLMVVAGQPRSTAEYIQASSRVGRRADRPGLVVTCFNLHKPRDRSHYERFTAFHDSFYRFVEAASLTPFSGPALDRGLAGALVALARHSAPALAPPEGAMALPSHRATAELAVAQIAARAADQPGLADENREAVRAAVAARGGELVEAWARLVAAAPDLGFRRVYSRFEDDRQRPLLRSALDALEGRTAPSADERRFTAPTSMRDVEPVTHLWLAPGVAGSGGR